MLHCKAHLIILLREIKCTESRRTFVISIVVIRGGENDFGDQNLLHNMKLANSDRKRSIHSDRMHTHTCMFDFGWDLKI